MYAFTSLDREPAPAGTSLLLVGDGPDRPGERLLAALAEGAGEEAALLVATERSAASLSELRSRGVPGDALGLVDASGAGETPDGVAEAAAVAGPEALPEIGVAASDRLERLGQRYDRIRVGLSSATGLLEASELAAVFRFLHVFAARVRGADATLLVTFDGEAHAEETVRTLAELFDDTVEIA